MESDEDPGWQVSPVGVLVGFIPGVGIWYRRRLLRAANDGLITLRQLFVSFFWAFVAFGVVVLLVNTGSDTPPTTFAVIVSVAGVASLVVVRLLQRPLDCTSDQSLAASYKTQFFLRLAFAEIVALIGFVGALVTGTSWLYFLGLAFTAVGLVRMAPTRARLREAQTELTLSGCQRSLVTALRTARSRG